MIYYFRILADDMGLGKTLTILSYLRLIKEEREEQEEDNEEDENERNYNDDDDDDEIIRKPKKKSSKRKSSKRLRTLIIVPASLLHQWQNEIANRFEKNSLKFHVYHEVNRKKLAYNLEDNDIVFTTYEIVTRELETLGDAKDAYEIKELLRRSNSPLASIKWKRIVLDEAHRIKNHNTKANKIICSLQSKYRLVLTGTPVQNSLTDFFSLIKFLHLEPLNDIKVWKYLFGNEKAESVTKPKSETAIKNAEKRDGIYNTWLLILSDTLILRRTKADKVSVNGELRALVALPEKKIDVVRVRLNKTEKFIYDKLFKESAEKVRKFLIQQQKRLIGASMGGNFSEILVYLLRLRQACSHISLLSECLDLNELQKLKSETEDVETMMGNLNLDNTSKSLEVNSLCNGVDDLDTCVDRNYLSAKLSKLLEMVDDITTNHEEDKIIIVSQWTSLLNIIGYHLKARDLKFYEIRGDVNLHKRNELVESFNKPYETDVKVMLLSLNAGGVGLNLIGANRMFLLDIHWNPALEQQAGDRIYRVGQKKNVNIYRFICEETIEERIQTLQMFKIEIANRVCNAHNGTVGVKNTKLTAKDIKLLFQAFDNPPQPPNPLQAIQNIPNV
jgi:transcription termination factor 2